MTLKANDYDVLLAKITGLSSISKIYALQILILSKLRNIDADEIRDFLRKRLADNTISFESLDHEINQFINSPDLIHNRIRAILRESKSNEVGRSEQNSYAILQEFVSNVSEMEARLVDIGKKYNKHVGSVEESLSAIEHHYKWQKEAMARAFEAMLNRLIESLDPESAEKYLDNSVVKLGPLKKAAQFDALKEKYEQIVSYQREGKMLRDFKVYFNAELKQAKKGGQE